MNGLIPPFPVSPSIRMSGSPFCDCGSPSQSGNDGIADRHSDGGLTVRMSVCYPTIPCDGGLTGNVCLADPTFCDCEDFHKNGVCYPTIPCDCESFHKNVCLLSHILMEGLIRMVCYPTIPCDCESFHQNVCLLSHHSLEGLTGMVG